MRLRPRGSAWGRLSTLTLALVCATGLPAVAQPKRSPTKRPDAAPAPAAVPAPPPGPGKKPTRPVKEQNFNFEGLGLNGRSRSPQLLYFLERANEELERASLEKRSFIPHIVRTVEEHPL